MNIDDKLIDKLAVLSSLKIDDSKKEDLKTQLAEIVNFVENLNEVDVSSVEATFTTIEGGTCFREDIPVGNSQMAQDIMANSPKSENNYFIVPKIIE